MRDLIVKIPFVDVDGNSGEMEMRLPSSTPCASCAGLLCRLASIDKPFAEPIEKILKRIDGFLIPYEGGRFPPHAMSACESFVADLKRWRREYATRGTTE